MPFARRSPPTCSRIPYARAGREMTNADTTDPVRAGAAAYARGAFFEAHEHFEEAWKASGTPRSRELHALAQIAAAMHKRVAHGKPEAARAIMARARAKLEGAAGAYVELGPLRTSIDAWLRGADASAPPIVLRADR